MLIGEYIREMQAHYFKGNCYHTQRNPEHNSTSGNHALINATHYTIVKKLGGKLTDDDIVEANNYIRDCKEREGIFNRAPDKFDMQAHDDYVGICCTSKQLQLPYAEEIYNYGTKHWWYFDNTEETPKFEFRNWFGRFVWTVFTFKACARARANLFLQLAFGLFLYTQSFNKDLTDTSGRILAWVQKEAVKGKYKLVDWFIEKWEADVKAKYPNGVGDIMSIYHAPDHPFALILKGVV